MSVKFDGKHFSLRYFDNVRYDIQSGNLNPLRIITNFIKGVFKGRKVTLIDYNKLLVKYRNCKIIQKMYKAKCLYDRVVKKVTFNTATLKKAYEPTTRINFDGQNFIINGLDTIRYNIACGNHNLLNMASNFFKGVKVQHAKYKEIKSKIPNKKIINEMRTAKRQYKMDKYISLDIDTIMAERREYLKQMRLSRERPDYFTDELASERKIQGHFFKEIKKALNANNIPLSIFDNKKSAQILSELKEMKILTTETMEKIELYLKDELDTSPFWK